MIWTKKKLKNRDMPTKEEKKRKGLVEDVSQGELNEYSSADDKLNAGVTTPPPPKPTNIQVSNEPAKAADEGWQTMIPRNGEPAPTWWDTGKHGVWDPDPRTLDENVTGRYKLIRDNWQQSHNSAPSGGVVKATTVDLSNDPIAQRISKRQAQSEASQLGTSGAPDLPDYDAIAKSYEAKADAERKADAKRQKRRALFSAIGDGVSSLANIYYATKGAPDMLKGTTSLSAKNQERWDKYVKGRDARLAEYKKVALDKAGEDYEHRYTRWRDEVKDIQEAQKQELDRIETEHKMKVADIKARRDNELASVKLKLMNEKAEEAKWDAEIAKVDAKYAEELKQEEIANIRKRTSVLGQPRTVIRKGGSGGGGKSKKGGSGRSTNGNTVKKKRKNPMD